MVKMMDKLYVILIVLIVIYVGINMACDNVPVISHSDDSQTVDGNALAGNVSINLPANNSSAGVISNGLSVFQLDSFSLT